MSNWRETLGLAGEDLAVAYLKRKGLTIVDRRVRCRHGELDIVARDGAEWVFVEVKARTGARMGHAAEAMTRSKVEHMRRAVLEYVNRHRLHEEPIRCDLVAIEYNHDAAPDLRHYPGGIELR